MILVILPFQQNVNVVQDENGSKEWRGGSLFVLLNWGVGEGSSFVTRDRWGSRRKIDHMRGQMEKVQEREREKEGRWGGRGEKTYFKRGEREGEGMRLL